MRPASPLERISTDPGFGVDTTAVPDAKASRYGRPNPSYELGRQKTQERRSSAAISWSKSFEWFITFGPRTDRSATK
jgi:hypothetical protein